MMNVFKMQQQLHKKWSPKKISNIKPFINNYNWDKIKKPLKNR